MKDHRGHKHEHGALNHGRGRHTTEPAFQVICLGSGGGPTEDNVTGFLIRSISKNWAKGSVLALDAGCHLASITKLLEPNFPLVSDLDSENRALNKTGDDQSSETSDSVCSSSPERETRALEHGPFAGLPLPFESARANAVHIVRECVSTYLISHPHLDHLSGFVINTAAFHNTSRPKKIAALPSTVNAIKTHIFNDVIWPNLTDEDGGVGFVTFQRLAQGGNIAVGEGSGKGYIEVCDGLCVKGLKVSHGRCTPGSNSTAHRTSEVGLSGPTTFRGSISVPMTESPTRAKRTPSFPQLMQQSSFPMSQAPGTPPVPPPQQQGSSQSADLGHHDAVVDSTAYFIRDDSTRREVLFFGDVEPDSLSLNPRTAQVWTEATSKITHGTLRAILIECSYDDSQADTILFGHLAPRHLIRELQVLAGMVRAKRLHHKNKREGKKRKLGHMSVAGEFPDVSGPPTEDERQEKYFRHPHKRKNRQHWQDDAIDNPMHQDSPSPTSLSHPPAHTDFGHGESESGVKSVAPLAGITVVVIHVKDTLRDGPVVGKTILSQLKEHEAQLQQADGIGLGCEFVISEAGESYWF